MTRLFNKTAAVLVGMVALLEVLILLAQGHTSKMIADPLCISPTTVRNHIQHILEKLGAHSRLQALAIAFHPGARSAQ